MTPHKVAVALTVVLALLFGLQSAGAAPTLTYEGSFNLPSGSAWDDHYAASIVYVPDGTPREAGDAVTGPTLVVTYNHLRKTVEFNGIPALSKTVVGMGSATWVESASNGTFWDGDRWVVDVDENGTLWDINPVGGSSSPNDGPFRDPAGGHILGGTSATVLNADWYNTHPLGFALRRGDGAGNDLTTDSAAVGAKFILTQRDNPGNVSAYAGYVVEATRTGTGENDISKTTLFKFEGDTDADRSHAVQYVRDTDGVEWFMLWNPRNLSDARSGDSNFIDFYAGNLSGGGDEDPDSIDVGQILVDEGPGWMGTDSYLKYVAVNWENSQIYVLEAKTGSAGTPSSRDARVHVFTVGAPVPEPATLALLGLGGLTLAGAARRRRLGR